MSVVPVVAPRPHPSVVEAVLDGAKVLFHLDDRRLHVLNDTAAAIWDSLARASTLGEVTAGLAERFAVDPRVIRADVEHALGHLHADGLVTWDDPVPTRAGASRLTTTGGRADAPAAGSYAALDARVALHCDDAEVLALLRDVLDPLAVADEATVSIVVEQVSERAWSVAAGGGAPVSVGSRLAVVLRTLGELNNVAVASTPHDLVLHAGAVGGPDGVVVLPAASNHGKSTLTTALVRTGLGYLTDEAAALTADLDVRPFPKAIALDPGSFPLFPDLAPPDAADGLSRAVASREWHLAPDRIGTVAGPGPARVVVCPDWRPGSATHLHRRDPTEALHQLIGEAFDFGVGGQAVFERLVALVERVPVYRLGYSDLAEAVDIVRRLLSDPEGGADAR